MIRATATFIREYILDPIYAGSEGEYGGEQERRSEMGKTVTIKRPDGKECTGYYEAPASAGKAPGVVVIQEWWGLN